MYTEKLTETIFCFLLFKNTNQTQVACNSTSQEKLCFPEQSVSRDDLHFEEEQLWEGPGSGEAGQRHAGWQRRLRRVSRHPTPSQPGVSQHVRR